MAHCKRPLVRHMMDLRSPMWMLLDFAHYRILNMTLLFDLLPRKLALSGPNLAGSLIRHRQYTQMCFAILDYRSYVFVGSFNLQGSY